MKLKLQEKPAEWRKFTLVMMGLMCLAGWVLMKKGAITAGIAWTITGVAAGAVVVSILHPQAFRGFYRAGMTVTFRIGQVMSRILLTLLYFLVITPLGLVLRVMARKDPLDLRWRERLERSWWTPAKDGQTFDKMF
ncbi:MAG: hypothetical protein FJ405_13465 [Verrucomicrobia bacterium]|nr:hypothetical protein [Verrucomicrobiota bacterium]